ncbi:MAG: DUF1439 domain-containing protein [Burkholderiaceae bacterium]
MKRRHAAVALLLPLLAGCAALTGPREIELPLSRLQAALDRRFPYNERVLGLFDVGMSRPALSLLPDKNRVRIDADTTVSPLLLGQTWRGSIAVSGRPALDAARSAVVLTAPTVEDLAIDGADAAVLSRLRGVGTVVAEQLLSGVPLYKFDPDRLSFAGVRFTPTALSIGSDRIVVTLEPVR